MATKPVKVYAITKDGVTMVECNKCGPVEITDLSHREAATRHLVLVHGINVINGHHTLGD